MKPSLSPQTFDQWMQTATRSLPVHITSRIRAELTSHYQDACDAYLHDGRSPDEAQQAAMSDLGSAALVNDGLRAAHLSRGHALAAMLVCMGYPLLLMVYPRLTSVLGEIGSYLVQDLLNTMMLVYVLATFVRLIGFNTRQLNRPVGLLMVSLLLGTVTRLAYFTIFHKLPLIGVGDAVVWSSGSTVGILLEVGFIAAELLSAGACAWLGWRLYHLREQLYGLLRAISILMMLVCPIGVGVALSLLFGSMLAASYFSALGYVVVTLLMAVLILTFFRAVFRSSNEPFQAA